MMSARLLPTLPLLLGLQLAAAAPAQAAIVLPAARLAQFCTSEATDYRDGFCTGYILGMANGLDRRPGGGVCAPEGITVRQLRDKVTGYFGAHPAVLQRDSPTAIAIALRAGLPCRK
jgi:hypothetical protein